MRQNDVAAQVEAIRRFNRFYTKQIGVLREGWLESPFSLTEVRVLYELAHADGPTASELVQTLDLDAGYLSRILRRFAKQGLVTRTTAADDARRSHLRLTARGKREFEKLQKRTRDELRTALEKLSDEDRTRLVSAMGTIESVIGEHQTTPVPFVLRPHRPGDMGWIVHRHGVLYAREYGWDERFEALVAEIVAEFIKNFDSRRERCWIAERDGEIVGSIFLVKGSDTLAKLRLLLVEPKARGLGIGARLVHECVETARQLGYKRMTLWTQSNLDAARHLYQREGFELMSESQHNSFGYDLTAQVWERDL
jgi:DNA-binding MarR family transcriptional regulator/N-acetylglutamate synthase-like GNAT family acetyltransferase